MSVHKRKLLFVMNNLHCGGAEKSLVSLLQAIDYDSCEVDLLLFKREGLFLNGIPEQVRVLEEPAGYALFDMPIRRAIVESLSRGRLDLVWARLRAGMVFRREPNKARREQLAWRFVARALPMLAGDYDAAIGYLEKSPVYYVVDKVTARSKIGFIHNDYDKMGMDPMIDTRYFGALDTIATVSEECVNILANRFPLYREKIALMHNLISPAAIEGLAEAPDASQETTGAVAEGCISIASVGRLNYQKGFELAVEACGMLVQDGYPVTWTIVGEGEERPRLERLIAERGLERHVVLAGLKENPYPYIRRCDVYVQTSYFEGRCMTITEAKILHKPIVSTDFSVIYDQLQDGVNGLIVGQTAEAVYRGVKRLLDDETLRGRLVRSLKRERLGTDQEVRKLYDWIDRKKERVQ